mmetsp:Transcript_38122/g.82077  ORF Transcript_38122/g.82077 Transcript_38122/m.82077 type:complete len:89 (-) Transcript_38122:124-390(-)
MLRFSSTTQLLKLTMDSWHVHATAHGVLPPIEHAIGPYDVRTYDKMGMYMYMCSSLFQAPRLLTSMQDGNRRWGRDALNFHVMKSRLP